MSTQYHKIQTVYKRDPMTNYKTLLDGEFSLPEFEYLANNDWVWTEKVDGTNIRVIYQNGQISFGGKSDRAQLPDQLVKRLQERFPSYQREAFRLIFGDTPVTLYGEGYGPKIQNGGKYRPDQDFVLFDVRVGDLWLERCNVEDIANRFELDIVPIIGHGTLYEMVENAKAGLVSTWGEFEAEGYVARPATELRCRNGARVITKIKCRDFK